MAAGDILPVFAASSDLTVSSGLNSLAASSTWIAGWESASIDLTDCLDASIDVKITVGSTNLQAGEIRVYFVRQLSDSAWPDVFDGTGSAETVTDTEMRDAICRLGAFTITDTGASDAYFMTVPSVRAVFNGNLPSRIVVFITHNAHTSTNAIASSGQQVTVKKSYVNVAS